MAGDVRIFPGARATESALIEAAREELLAARRDSRRLARPLRVVVPSHSLRVHLGSRLVAACGGVAGIQLQTLRGLAMEVLERSGLPIRPGDAWLRVLVARRASAQPALHKVLEPMRDGYGSVTPTVADLLDAGLEPVLAEGVAEAIAASGLPAPVRARAEAVVAVALEVQAELEASGLVHRSGLLAMACRVLEEDPARFPARGVWVHGFADVTGAAGDLLDALRRAFPTVVFADVPPPPSPVASDGSAFVKRFLDRVGAGGPLAEPPPPPAAPVVRLMRAPGADAEVRGAAERVRAILDAGVEAEEIGLVARDLRPYRIPLRRHLTRLAIPFSAGNGVSAPANAGARGAEALLELLRSSERMPAERWLELSAAGSAAGADDAGSRFREAADLRVAYHAAGAGRLGEVAALDPTEWVSRDGSVRLPIREGPRAGADSAVRSPRRRIPAHELISSVDRARATLARLRGWPRGAPFAAHRSQLLELLQGELRWEPRGETHRAVEAVLDTLAAELHSCLLAREELLTLLERPLRSAFAESLGGAGAGVAVLTVMEARARSFAHLFVLGANRERFPRPVHEDVLLPDSLRRGLAASVLPDIPVKERGFDEERYLFAQLLSASPEVSVSWQLAGDDGRTLNRSPFVEGLRLGLDVEVETLPPVVPGPLPEGGEERARASLRPAHEHAVLAGLYGTRARHREALAQALAERGPAAADPAALAAVRSAVLREHELDGTHHPRLGPYLGWVGPPSDAADPRTQAPWVTHLEGVARCPWQGFLRKVLRVEALPDALDALPEVDARLVGSTTHRVLERIAGGEKSETLATVLAREPRPLGWPGAATLAGWCHEAAASALREEGLPGGGFAEWLAAQVRERVERAGELLRASPGSLLAAEVEGALVLATEEGEVLLRFKADLVESTAAGPRLTDYKTGAPPTERSADALRRSFERDVARGERLQAVAYALAVGEGRYLHLAPDLPCEEAADLRAPFDDAALASRFAASAAVLMGALHAGQLPPRLFDAKLAAPRACDYCEVASACVRGDSAARRRLLAWTRDVAPIAQEANSPASGATLAPTNGAADASARALWALGSAE